MKVSGQTVPTPDLASLLSVVNKGYATRAKGTYSFRGQATVAAGATEDFEFGIVPYAGYAIGVSVEVSDARTAGTMTANLQVEGSTVLTATVDDTNTLADRDTDLVNTHAVAAGDSVRVRVTASGDWTPDTPVTVRVQAHFSAYDFGSLPSFSGVTDYAVFHKGSSSLVPVNDPIPIPSFNRSAGSSISLASDQFTLQPGFYFIQANIHSYRVDTTAGHVRFFELHNIGLDQATEGFTTATFNALGLGNGGGPGTMSGFLEILAPTTFEIRITNGTTASNTVGAETTLCIARLDA